MSIHNRGMAMLAVGILSTAITMTSAVAAQKKTEEAQAPLPIVVTSDHMRYHDDTGDIIAEGNVVVTQGVQKLSAAVVEGNSKSGDVRIDGRALYEALDSKQNIAITGGPVVYNWVQRKGVIDEPKGHINNENVRGESIDLLPDRYVVNNGRMTRCHKDDHPHYCMTADRIEIIPNVKMTAYNVKMLFRGTILYSQSKYTSSLKPEDRDKQSAFPRMGYRSENGFYVTQQFNQPLTDRWSVFADASYYSKHGFTPSAGLQYVGDGYDLRIVDGIFRDNDGDKITKEPELQLLLGTHQIGDTPYHYAIWGTYGKWNDDEKSSWHSEEKVYLSRDPIYMDDDKSLWLSLGTGVGYMHESYLSDGWATTQYDAVVYKSWQRWQANTGYHYNRENRNLFEYEKADLSDYWETGLMYHVNAKDSFGLIMRYDMQDNRVYDMDYKWIRNLDDCFQTEFTYRQKQRKWEYKIHLLAW